MSNIKKFIQYLEENKAECERNRIALSNDSRADEAILIKIRENIFGIMVSACQAAEKQSPDNATAFIQDKIRTIPKAWSDSLALAEKNADHSKAAIERFKLEVISEINMALCEITEKCQ